MTNIQDKVYFPSASDVHTEIAVIGDTQPRIRITPNGISIGPGGAVAPDIAITRGVTGGLLVTGGITLPITNVTAATSTLTPSTPLVVLNAAAGCAVTLPAATGTGLSFRIFIGTTITSNSTTIKVANASDIMSGMCFSCADAGTGINAFETGATDDTITFNGGSTGGIKGDLVELFDIGLNLWAVQARTSSTGSEGTPFSATV
jgi:hypothetical protein